MSDQVNQHFDHSNIQTGTHQQSSSTQHCDNSHRDSSEVTDQTSSQWTPHPLQGLPHLPYHHGNQQQLQDGARSLIDPQSKAVPHQHIPPSDRTLPHHQTLTCPSDETQTSIQYPQKSSSLSADFQFTPNPYGSFRTAYQQLTPSSPQGLLHEPTNQTNMYTLHPTQGMIHSGGSTNSVNVTMRTVASQPASPFPETAEQISNQPQLILHPQASQHISQTGALQQPSSTQRHVMPHGDSSVVTDQIYSPYPHHLLPHRPPYHCTIQQHLHRRPIFYLQAMPHSRQHTFPSNETVQPQSIQHHDSSSNLTTGQYSQGTPHPHHNQPPLPHNPHQVQPYRHPPHQTNQQYAPHPLLHSQLPLYQGIPLQPFSPHHPGYSDSPALNTLYQTPCYHHQQHHHLREHSQIYSLQYTHNASSITHLGLPSPPVKPYFSIQSGYAHVDTPAQQSLMNQSNSNQSSANLASLEPTKPHSPSTSQPTTLSANRTDSAASSSPMSLDAPDPKRACLSPHSSSTTPRALEIGLPEPSVTSLSTGRSYVSCDNSSVVGLPSSGQKHRSIEHSDVSPSNASPLKPTFNIVYDRLIPICSEWHNFGLALGLTQNKLKEIDSDNKMCKNCLRETLSVRINDTPLTWRDVVNALRKDTVRNNELAQKIESEFSEQLDLQIQLDDPANQEQGFEKITSRAINLPDCVVRYSSYLKDKYKRMPVLPDTWPPPLVGQDHFTNLALIEKRNYLKLPQAKSKHSIEYDYACGNVDNIVERKQAIKLENLFEPLPGEDSTQDQLIILMDGAPGVGKTTISRKICKDWSRDELRAKFYLVIFLPLRELFIACHDDSSFSLSDLLYADDPELKHQVLQYIQRTSGDGVLFIFDGFDELSFHQRTKHSLFLDIVKGKRLHKCSVLVTSRTYASGPLREISRINRHVEVLGFNKRQINNCIKENITEKEKAKLLLDMLKERLDIISLCYIPLNCRIVLYVYQQQYTLPDTLTELYKVFILYTMKHYTDRISSEEEIVIQIKQANSLEKLPAIISEHLHNLTQVAYTGLTQDRLVFEYSELGVAKGALSLGLLNMIDTTTNDREEHYYQFLHFTIQEFLAAKYLAEKLSTDEQLQFVRSNINVDRFRITLLFLAGLTGLNFIPDRNSFSVQPLFQLSLYGKRERTRFLFITQLLYESRRKTCDWLLSCLGGKKFSLFQFRLTQFDCVVIAYFLSVTPKDHIWDEITIQFCKLKTYQLKLLFCKLHVETNAPILSTTKKLKVYKSDGTISFSWLLPLISGCSKVEELWVPQFSQSEKSSCQLSPILNDVFTFKILLVGPDGDCCGLVRDTVLDLKGMNLYICPKLLSMFLKHLNPKKAWIIDLGDHPEVFQDCSRCDTFSSVVWKSLYGAFDTFENLQELAITPLNTEHAFLLMNRFSGNKLVTDFSDSLINSEELIILRNHLTRVPMMSIRFKGLKFSLGNDTTFNIKIGSAIGDSQHCLGYLRILLEEKLPPNFININVTCSFLTEDMGKWLGANSDLKELTVNLRSESVWSLSDEFSSVLAQCVSHSATLEVLKIENCELTDNQLETISNSLPHTSSLKELHFQSISRNSLSALFQAVRRNTSLCKLDCKTTSSLTYPESCRALCDMITNNTVLQELSIHVQYIGGEYEMFVNTLLQSTTTRRVTVGSHYKEYTKSLKEVLSKYDKGLFTSQDCWTLGSVTLTLKLE